MDLIRYELLFRSKLYENTAKKGMFGVLASQKIIYKKPLKMFKKFDITLVLEGSDDKWAYHKQIFKQNDQVCAIGYTKAGFWKNKKVQNINKILIKSEPEYVIKLPKEEVLKMFDNDYSLLKKQE